MAVRGERILQLGRKHIGEPYVLGSLAPKDNPKWKGPWDCAEFASWLVFQAVGVLYGCASDSGDPASADAYTGYWERDAEALGVKIPVEQAARMPGAAVLRSPQPGATGHIAISDRRSDGPETSGFRCRTGSAAGPWRETTSVPHCVPQRDSYHALSMRGDPGPREATRLTKLSDLGAAFAAKSARELLVRAK